MIVRSFGLIQEEYAANLLLVATRRETPPEGPLRTIRYYDQEQERMLTFLCNHMKLKATSAAALYKLRWQVELFFRWIKQNLRIKHFYGNSANAVKTQIWIAVTVYVIVAILHKQLKLPGPLHRSLQILSVHPFEKTPVNELLTQTDHRNQESHLHKQLLLW